MAKQGMKRPSSKETEHMYKDRAPTVEQLGGKAKKGHNKAKPK